MFRVLFCRVVLSLLLFATCMCSLAAADEPKKVPPTKEQLAQWVRDLGHDDFEKRENASQRLWEAGPLAEAVLKEAINSNDAEVTRRSRELLDKVLWGIFPDTPIKVAEMIKRYKDGANVEAKRAIVQELLDEGIDGHTAFAKISAAEDKELFDTVRVKAAVAFLLRSDLWYQKKDYERAIKDFDEALRLNPKLLKALNNKAWVLASCPDKRYRDGKKAVELATKACELTEWKDPMFLDTLAIAYAETGDFDKAVEYVEKALLNKEYEKEYGDDARGHLKLFKDKKPFREM